jgi:hypothetical protein
MGAAEVHEDLHLMLQAIVGKAKQVIIFSLSNGGFRNSQQVT